mgnify:CR=1 FL=1
MLLMDSSKVATQFTAVYASGTNRFKSEWDIGQALTLYTQLFWKSYLGVSVWSLYDTLKTAVVACAAGWMEPPTINELVALVGQGDRYTILGRAATETRPAQKGTLDTLERENIVVVSKTGPTNHRVYNFGILMQLPILTPFQVDQLPKPIQKKHNHFLGALRGFDLPVWRKLDMSSFVLHQARENGRAWLGEDPYPNIPQPRQPLPASVIQSALVRDSYNCRICSQTAVTAVPLTHGADHLISLCAECEHFTLEKLRQNGRIVIP